MMEFTSEQFRELKALERKELARNYLPFAKITLLLPWAPSVNNAYPTGRNGKRFPSPALKQFKRDVWTAIYSQNIGRPMHAHPMRITIIQHSASARGDISNGVKAVEDALVTCGIIADDNREIVKEIVVRDGARSKTPRITVTIEPFMKN